MSHEARKSFQTYYTEEYDYLLEAGREFSHKRASKDTEWLNLAQEPRDPNVERLLEGFAFLTARVRQKLDAELPEFTNGLLEILAPQFLRPFPAMAMLQFEPIGNLREIRRIAAGTEVVSDPIERKDRKVLTAYGFQTCWEVELQPLRLHDVRLSDDRREITLAFKLSEGASFNDIFKDAASEENGQPAAGASSIRILIHSDPSRLESARELYYYLFKQTREILLSTPGTNKESSPRPLEIRPLGLNRREGLLPQHHGTLWGQQVIFDFFSFPQKFLFFEVAGLNRHNLNGDQAEFEVKFMLNAPLPFDVRVSRGTFLLHCTPVRNLVSGRNYSFLLNHYQTEYAVEPRGHGHEELEVYSIDNVTGVEQEGGRRMNEYYPFHEFRHVRAGREADAQASNPRYYKASSGVSAKKRWETNIAFGGHDDHFEKFIPEAITITTTCSYGYLDSNVVEKIKICNASEGTSDILNDASFRNITQPSQPIYPPAGSKNDWQLLSHVALNFLSLADLKSLQDFLTLYNWNRDALNNKMIDSILRVSAADERILLHGSIVRGKKICLLIDKSDDEGLENIYQFGLVLHEVFASFAPMNTFIALEIETHPQKEKLAWPPKIEEQMR